MIGGITAVFDIDVPYYLSALFDFAEVGSTLCGWSYEKIESVLNGA